MFIFNISWSSIMAHSQLTSQLMSNDKKRNKNNSCEQFNDNPWRSEAREAKYASVICVTLYL